LPSSMCRFALNEILSTENKLAIKHLVIFVYVFSVNEAVVILGVDTKVLLYNETTQILLDLFIVPTCQLKID